ncbi:GNAT family N-acetyltransferase [Modestobacter sp. VKM Ac-2984]|uniref:GNAT family N-acetyltransferase n=1 Tax=Modestobacter sp. VKM Ac-2984 TaxID=3004138 RepID=UPI0022AB2B74|nr:GNAT family N-acetyltransferase [Modestobacter sp. VKM Ac-2984]MCZ2815385.1 GNAT family N-acetyltransferase [Modestobacter sp. VKM Ac-2984]
MSGPSPSPVLRPMTAGDWPAVRAIHAAGIATGLATFETEPPSWAAFDASRLSGHRHVATDGAGTVLGWVACSRESPRAAYTGVVDHSVYVAPDAAGRGIGRLLLQALVDSTEADGIWTIRAAVFPANTASLALHERLGFRVVGRRERIGRRVVDGRSSWHDVLFLERRSRVVGWADDPA